MIPTSVCCMAGAEACYLVVVNVDATVIAKRNDQRNGKRLWVMPALDEKFPLGWKFCIKKYSWRDDVETARPWNTGRKGEYCASW